MLLVVNQRALSTFNPFLTLDTLTTWSSIPGDLVHIAIPITTSNQDLPCRQFAMGLWDHSTSPWNIYGIISSQRVKHPGIIWHQSGIIWHHLASIWHHLASSGIIWHQSGMIWHHLASIWHH